MKGASRLAGAALIAVAACGPGAPPPPASAEIGRVAVLRVANDTGDPLTVTGDSLLERWVFHGEPATVPDVLAESLRATLARRGVAVVEPSAVDAATAGRPVRAPEAAADAVRRGDLADSALLVELRRWAGDGGEHPAFVIVGLDAMLVRARDAAVLWQVHRTPRPVPTPGAVTVGAAYAAAADAVATELVGTWGRR